MTPQQSRPWFNSVERVGELSMAAKTWLGTPFFPNGRLKGEGVSCQTFAPLLYVDCGFLPKAVADLVPDGPMDWDRANKESLIAKHIDLQLQEYFVSIDPSAWAPIPGPALFGDLLGFEVRNCVQHLGVCLGHEFIHIFRPNGVRVTEQGGVHLSRMDDATYLSRLRRIWRPVEYGS